MSAPRLPVRQPKASTFAERSLARALARDAKRAPTWWPGKRFAIAALPPERMLERHGRGWCLRGGLWDGAALQVEGSA